MFIGHSCETNFSLNKRNVKPHQHYSDPTPVFLSRFFMYFSRKKDSLRKIKAEKWLILFPYDTAKFSRQLFSEKKSGVKT